MPRRRNGSILAVESTGFGVLPQTRPWSQVLIVFEKVRSVFVLAKRTDQSIQR